MKNIIKYIFIGFIQGITEFLPVSSSGHVVLFGSIFNLNHLMLISVVAHVGTLFAVVYCYRKRIFELIKHPKDKTNFNLVLATIPSVVMVLLFNSLFEDNFSSSSLVWGFLLSAVLLVIADLKKDGTKYLTKKSSFIMGISQGFALLPGISRSGTTLACGLIVGLKKKEALDFSFLMSIPIILASAVYECFKLFETPISFNWLGIFIVLVSSFVFGILSIKIMLNIMQKNKLFYFSFYLIILSLISLFLI